MTAWTLKWNDLTDDQRARITQAAEYHACPCCGDPGQMALDLFRATIQVVQERDRAEVEATLGSPTCAKCQGDECDPEGPCRYD